jgi:putative PEP-CTERM system integral membrane protein
VENVTNQATDPAFAPVAARLLIAQATRQAGPPTVPQLDALHTMAQAHSVVTPYSSMLVLVNTQQREALDKAQASDDRFERAQESGVETLTRPHNLLTASAAPEPEEWLLLLVSLALAAWMLRQRRLENI